jgi:aliphatic sulfonates family ABC transporter substrate-binding protein
VKRRTFLAGAAALALPLAARGRAQAAGALKELRVGYQKIGALLVVKAQKVLEKRFEPQGISVKWVEFQFGPPLLEALSAGAIDYGYTGDAPPIFAQAAHANLLYAAAIPARGYGQAIVVPAGSPIQAVADLKGKKVGVAKASSGHNLLVAALEAANVAWSEITPVYLAPADAGAAFARGAIDAWSIWDPFLAVAELKQNARALPVDEKAAAQNSFFLVNRDFAAEHGDAVAAINEEIGKTTAWAGAHRDDVAALYVEASGLDLAVQKKAVDRAEFTFGPLTDVVLSQQQDVADRFRRLGLIPSPIAVRDIVWPWKASHSL